MHFSFEAVFWSFLSVHTFFACVQKLGFKKDYQMQKNVFIEAEI